MDDGIQQLCCSAPLSYNVAAGYNAPRRAQEAGHSEDSATVTMMRWEEVYTSIWEHQGRCRKAEQNSIVAEDHRPSLILFVLNGFCDLEM